MRMVVLSSLLFACSSDANSPSLPGDASARQVVSSDEMLLVGGVTEGTLTGSAGDAVRIVLAAPTANLAWNLHSHVDGTQTIKSEENVIGDDYTFIPEIAADWFLTLRNEGPGPLTVHVELSLYANMAWSGWN